MNRPNQFRPIHKALRSALFESTALVARTDFGDPTEAAAAVASVGAVLNFLDDHAEHEHQFVFPARLAAAGG
jgi:hypothetical protein